MLITDAENHEDDAVATAKEISKMEYKLMWLVLALRRSSCEIR